jgi:hypothetical protein
LPAGFWIASGVGAAALTTGIVFAALGSGNQSDVEACAPSCGVEQRDAYDAMQTQYLVADISFVVAAASAGVATWFFLTRDSSSASAGSNSAERQQPRWSLQPMASLRGGGVSFTASGF